jgi:spore maturation protein CgeB
MLTPEPYRLFTFGQKVANQLARRVSVSSVNLGVRKIRLNRSYNLFIMICQFPRDLLSLNAIEGWKQRCRTSVCWLAEIWASELHKLKGHLKILSQFDYVIIPSGGSVKTVRDLIGDSCVYIPPGINTIRFCPYPDPPVRSIDVYSMGRKSSVTHQALLKMVEQRKIFYIYDTFENMKTFLPRDHRILLANITKRSRYFIANAPKINQQSETGGQMEISYRFFEGAASGTVMIGETGKNEALKEHFGWSDSVIQVPFDSPNIAEVLADLDSQPERLAEIRKNNVVNCLLRHDWVYRWRAILDMVGLKPRPALIAREKLLKKLAKGVTKTSS